MSDSGYHIQPTDNRNQGGDKGELAQISVEKKALTLEQIADKLQFALDQYRRATYRYQKGEDFVGDWEKCIQALELEMVNVREYLAVSHHNIGVIYFKEGKLEAAVDHFERALSIKSKYGGAAFNLAVALHKLGRKEESKKWLERSKSLGYQPKKRK